MKPTLFTFPPKPELTPEAIAFWGERLPKLLVGRDAILTIIYDDSYGRDPEIVQDGKIERINDWKDGRFSIDVKGFGIYCDCIPVHISRERILYTLSYAGGGGVQYRIWKIPYPTRDEGTYEEREAWSQLWYATCDEQHRVSRR
jgi:hypothetical protein